MREVQRRTLLLVSFMAMLAVVVLFLFVYSSKPLEAAGFALDLPEPYSSILNSTVQGWEGIFETFKGMNTTATYPS